jgi:tetratricopeptide (TPR) repeat protein
MWENKKTEKIDMGAGYGVLEYDFFAINGDEELVSLINYYTEQWKRLGYNLGGYSTTKNNTELSPNVQAKMKEHNTNISITFLEGDHKEKNVQIRQMIVNEQKQDGTFDTRFFNFYIFEDSAQTYIKPALKPELTYEAKSEAKSFPEAPVECSSELIKLAANSARFYKKRAEAYDKAGDFDRAIENYSLAIELDANDASTYFGRSQAYALKDNDEAAIADSTKAIQLDPNNGWSYCNRGGILADIGRYDEAITNFSKAIELGNDYSYTARAIAYKDKGDYKRAKADFLKALEINPDNKLAKERFNGLGKW